jgi:hypothetical protein
MVLVRTVHNNCDLATAISSLVLWQYLRAAVLCDGARLCCCCCGLAHMPVQPLPLPLFEQPRLQSHSRTVAHVVLFGVVSSGRQWQVGGCGGC